jgi:hypothetical protein
LFALAGSRLCSGSREVRELGKAPALQELEKRHEVRFREDSLEGLGWKPGQQGVAHLHRVAMLRDGHGLRRIRLVAEAGLVPKRRKSFDFHDSFPQVMAVTPVRGQPLPVEKRRA